MKLYEKHWTGDSRLTVAADLESKCFALDYPHESHLEKVIVVQVGGTMTDFSIDLFNKPCADICSEFSSAAGCENEALCKVLPTQTALAGVALEVFRNPGYMFRNMVGTQTVPVKRIYLRITPDAPVADDTLWDVAIAGENAN